MLSRSYLLACLYYNCYNLLCQPKNFYSTY
nr:MAG TPA: hypothetical protein [Caudoviricetes sp.]